MHNNISSRSRSQDWYDSECRSLKKLVTAALIMARESHLEAHYVHLKNLKKQYKETIKCKKEIFIKNTWKALINAAKQTNRSLFWHPINPLLKVLPLGTPNHITALEWVEHFQGIYASEEPSCPELRSKLLAEDLLTCNQ